MFETEALHNSVMTQLMNVPEDHKVAVVVVANNSSARLAFASRLNDEWKIESYASVEKNHGYELGASVQWSR